MKMSIIAITLLAPLSVNAQESINIYGPGGPAPGMGKNAEKYQEKFGIPANLTFGPQNKWQDSGQANADLILSGSKVILHKMKKKFDLSNSTALYMRPVSILVRKNNPKAITGINSLLSQNVKLMVLNGAGQDGLWEDVSAAQEKLLTSTTSIIKSPFIPITTLKLQKNGMTTLLLMRGSFGTIGIIMSKTQRISSLSKLNTVSSALSALRIPQRA